MNRALATLRSDKHVSVSSLNTYIRCPKQYEHRYLLKTPETHRPSAMAFGSAIHEALAEYYSSMRNNVTEPSIEKLSDSFRDAWKRQLQWDVPVLFGDKESADKLTDTGIDMLNVFLEKATRYPEIVDIEMPFSIELFDDKTGEVLPRLIGVFDAVVRDEKGFYRILEHKTAARRWSADKLAFDPQITAYHVAAPFMGLGDASVTIQLLLKTKKTDLEIYTPIRNRSDKRDFIHMAIGVLKAVRAGAFYPVRDWHCTGCQYASRCIAG